MAEQTFRSPGFFEREIDASQRQTEIVGVPAGVVGTAEKGPAFIPVTVGSTADFINKFGDMDSDRFGPYAVDAFLTNRTALTYVRVLGAGSNQNATDIGNTNTYGIVKNAGFILSGGKSTWVDDNPRETADGAVQFLVAQHHLSASTDFAFPLFQDNDSYNLAGAGNVKLVRGVIFTATGSRLQVMDMGGTWLNNIDDSATPDATGTELFKICISSSAGATFTSEYRDEIRAGLANPGATDGDGVKIRTASLDPTHQAYIGNVLNTDPLQFAQEKHLLYLDLAVEKELAVVSYGDNSVAILSGSSVNLTGSAHLSGIEGRALNVFGRYDTRYRTPKSPDIISQPFGGKEYDLFHFETLSDGAWSNNKVKVTIANLRASTNENYPYPSFEVQVRKFDDSDLDQQVLESFPGCVLDPDSENFVGKKVGDYKARYNFDASNAQEKRIIVTGRYPNVSNFVRVVVKDAVYKKNVPASACPFGFKGVPVLKTNDTMTDSRDRVLEVNGVTYGADKTSPARLTGSLASATWDETLAGSILPPMPFRYKVTRGQRQDGWFSGYPGTNEVVDSRLNWGVKWSRMPETGSMSNARLNPNASSVANPLITAYGKFQGLAEIGAILTGSGASVQNSNKFTLARVCLTGTGSVGDATSLLQHVTGSAKQHLLEAAYIRNGIPDSKDYTIMDPDISGYGRVTLATLIQSASVKFNRFTAHTAFNIPIFGGFDGLNILDKDMYYMNDRASSTDGSSPGKIGKASSEFTVTAENSGLVKNVAGTGRENNHINSYREAVNIITDPMSTRVNILAVPGIRDSFVTDHAAEKTKDYSMAIYLMDIPSFSESETRLFSTEDRTAPASASLAFPDVRETAEQFESRVFDNNYTAAYFPDVYITDKRTGSKVRVPASVAAIGALAFNDSVAYPWFAPAGFNRGGLDTVANTDIRLTAGDRDTLYDARVNPIANFADGSFVIFGQKTCQLAQSALDRVNVRRMLLELKRQVVTVADKILFEPNTPATRARFINSVTPLLATIQSQQGIESFKVVMDDTNNSQEDVESNRLNGRIVVVPTRAIEFIAIDFVITNSGVDFQ